MGLACCTARPTIPAKLSFVALDLDGTTLNTDHKISTKNLGVIRDVLNRKIGLAIATGRSMSGIYEHLEKIKPSVPVPVLSLNGALCLRYGVDGKITEIFKDPVPADIVKEVVALGLEKGFMVQFYISDEIYAYPQTEKHIEHMKKYESLAGHPQKVIKSEEELMALGQPAKILLFTDDPDSLIKFSEEKFGDRVHLVRGSPVPFFVEYLAKGVCKGNGLLKLCKELKIDPKSVLAFGDGDNDKEFLELSGYGVAMKNARDVTKAKADYVLQWTNDEDGVGRQLELMIQEGKLNPPE